MKGCWMILGLMGLASLGWTQEPTGPERVLAMGQVASVAVAVNDRQTSATYYGKVGTDAAVKLESQVTLLPAGNLDPTTVTLKVFRVLSGKQELIRTLDVLTMDALRVAMDANELAAREAAVAASGLTAVEIDAQQSRERRIVVGTKLRELVAERERLTKRLREVTENLAILQTAVSR